MCSLLRASGWLIVAAIALFGFAAQSQAKSSAENKGQDIADTWQGTLHAGRDYRDVVKITKADDGGYKVVFYLPDQSGDGYTPSNVTIDGPTLKMGAFSGTDGIYPNCNNDSGYDINVAFFRGVVCEIGRVQKLAAALPSQT
jgi:hypothetical protein